jgi:serine/threonine protein kinase
MFSSSEKIWQLICAKQGHIFLPSLSKSEIFLPTLRQNHIISSHINLVSDAHNSDIIHLDPMSDNIMISAGELKREKLVLKN